MDRELADNLIESIQERTAPAFDLETEKALLSICIRDKEALDGSVMRRVVADDFSDVRNALIFEAISDLFLKGGKIDRYNICDNLEHSDKLQKAGGTEYVFSVANTAAVKINLDSYVNIVKAKSKTRILIDMLDSISKDAKKGSADVNTLVDSAISKLTAIREAPEGVGFEALNTILKASINEIHSIIASGGQKSSGVGTGFRKLDDMLGGLRPGTLNIIAARPGMGKTALVVNIATNVAAMRNYNVNIFSLEMSKAEVGNRILASRSDVTTKQLQRAKISPQDEIKLANAYKELSELPIYIDDNSMANPVSMKSECKKLKASGKLGLIIVDYLQLMSMPQMNKNANRQNEISEISRSLKVLAREMEVPVIALSQLSRGSEKREDHTPMLSDLRDSGAIEQDADAVIFIDRPDYYKKADQEALPKIQDANIIVAKNRHGETGTCHLKWWGEKTLFFEPDRPYDPVDPATNGSQSGSAYTRTQEAGASASDYHFESEDVPFTPDDIPPIPEDSGNPDNEAFFAESNDGFPEGF
ncbi:MAG: replicative DNA helicase [Saccharofermentans sp.]|nr:replicative DNA helicase [Saccharofermentans sp.]